MRHYVIDASVAVKWYSQFNENDLEKADKLLQSYADGICLLSAPTLIVYELANALRFNPNLESNDVRKAVSKFLQLHIPLTEPSDHVALAIDLAFRHTLTVHDSVYLALAQVTGIPLITADYRFHDKVKDLPFIEALRNLEF